MAARRSRERVPFFAERVVLLGVAVVCGSLAVAAPWAALTVLSAWVLLGREQLGLWGAGLACALFLVSGARASVRLSVFESARVEARDALGAPQRCSGRVRVTSSPTERTVQSMEGEGSSRVTVWTGESGELQCESRALRGEWRLRISGGPANLARGDEVEVIVGLAPIQLFRNAGLPDPSPGAARREAVLSGAALHVELIEPGRSLFSLIDRARARVRARIDATYAERVASLGRALVLGENDLPEEDAEAFSRSGLLHLLAVSGTHLVIAVLGLVQALRALLVRVGPLARRYDTPRVASALGAALSWLYAEFAGGSGSAFRAAYMLCIVLGARALGFRVGGGVALGASLLVGAAFDPLCGFDLSFLLSALATAGLIGLGQPLSRLTCRGILARGLWQKLWLSLIATVSSTIPCAPVLALMDGQMTWAALFANVVAAPLGELLALPACLLHAVSGFWGPLERGLALVGSGALFGVRAVALWSASVEWAQFDVPLPSSFGVAQLVLTGLLFCEFLMRGSGAREELRPTEGRAGARWLFLSGVVLLAFLLPRLFSAWFSSAPRSLTVTALDVGQGDAHALDFPDGSLGFVDGGGFPGGIPDTGERVLIPALRARGKKEVDLMVLSHAHPDHLLGLLSVAKKIRVREFWHPAGAAREVGAYKELLELVRRGGGRVLGPVELCDAPRFFGEAKVEVLAPCPSAVGQNVNDESLVMRVSWGERSALLTGDVEQAGERALMERYGSALRADFFKVPHHGSHTSSSPELLRFVRPSSAVISSGVRNRFEHPRPSTLRALESAQIQVWRTDRSGSVSFRTDGVSAEIRAFAEPR